MTVQVGPRQQRRLGTAQRKALAGERQAPLALFVRVGVAGLERADPQLGVDDDAAPRLTLVVLVRVGEDAQTHAHLRGGETDAGSGVHRLEQVGDELAHLVGDLVDAGGGSVQHGIAHDADREYGHVTSLSSGRAVIVEG